MKQKLTSDSGASITYALLLFLVCAVVSSVVLAAGTAASGRMSQAVENDQRYYSVTSAAAFLKNQIDGKSVTVKLDSEGVKTYFGAEEGDFLADISSSAVDYTSTDIASSYNLSVTGKPDTEVQLNTTIGAFGEDSTARKLAVKIKNSDTVGDSFVIELVFSGYIETWTEKTVSASKVTWNYYDISSGGS